MPTLIRLPVLSVIARFENRLTGLMLDAGGLQLRTLAEDVHVGSTHEAELHGPAPELNGDEGQEVLVGRRAIGICHHPYKVDGVV